MSIETILTHMNEHHNKELKDLVSHFAGFSANDVRLVDVSNNGLKIIADNRDVFAPFPSPVAKEEYKNAIISLCMSISSKDSKQDSALLDEIHSFISGFNTILLSSLSKDNKAHISYAPLLRYENNYYIYISEMANHCENLRTNPNASQVMFIEDERDANSILARKRLTYDISVEFMPRDELFEKVFDAFEAKVGKGGGVSTVRGMSDFHLVKLNFMLGRFVKGFGQAYLIKQDGSIEHLGGKGGNPHGNPHAYGNPHGGNPHNPHSR